MNEKIVSCSYSKCNCRRLHFEKPQFNRSRQVFSVPKDHPGPWFCSIECMTYHRAEGRLAGQYGHSKTDHE
jgi:hypothetical protein